MGMLGKIKNFFNPELKIKKLSKSTMETLAIIAYKGPITKSEIELIRGVSAEKAVGNLLEKNLVYISGKKKSIFPTNSRKKCNFPGNDPRSCGRVAPRCRPRLSSNQTQPRNRDGRGLHRE